MDLKEQYLFNYSFSELYWAPTRCQVLCKILVINRKPSERVSCLRGIYSLVCDINNPTNTYRKLCSYHERQHSILWKNIIRGLNVYGEPFLLKDTAHIKHYFCGLFVNMKMLGTMWALNVHSFHSQRFTINSCSRSPKYRAIIFLNFSALP